MKKLIALLTVAGILTFGAFTANAQPEGEASSPDTTAVEDTTAAEVSTEVEEEEPASVEEVSTETEVIEETSVHQFIKDKFIAGGPIFMAMVLVCLILGLAIVIERVLYLSMSTTNTKKLLNEVESALNKGGVEAAKEVCRNTRGPVASIFYQGLDRSTEGIEMVEKSVISYGSVQVGNMERNLSWISLFIALAPMLGFFGTVLGMIGAFDAIAAANNISPGIVAGGIGVALITTLSGLLVAMILQIFYNYIVSKVDSLTNEMEDASISLIDILVKYEQSKK